MDFDEQKQKYVEKLGESDKSRAGGPDIAIIPLLDVINNNNNLYTTSSCAGRIIIVEVAPTKKKHEVNWLYVTHDKATFEAITVALNKRIHGKQHEIYLKMESPILHICARDVKCAYQFMLAARRAGYKRVGIIGINKRIIIELLDNEKIEIPLSLNGELLTSADYLKITIRLANEKLVLARKKLEILKKEIKGLSSTH